MPNEMGLPEGVTSWRWDAFGDITALKPIGPGSRRAFTEGRFLTLPELEEWKRAVVEARAKAEKAEAEVSRLREAIKTADPIAWQEGFKDGAKFKGEELKVARKEAVTHLERIASRTDSETKSYLDWIIRELRALAEEEG